MEEPLDWQSEAEYIINDIKDFVKDIEISKQENGSEDKVYLNATTVEGETYCIELCQSGFRVVAKEYNSFSPEVSAQSPWYDTPYALFNTLSPQFRTLFSNKLAEKLEKIQQDAIGNSSD